MNYKRIKQINSHVYASGPIVYWMNRDQRVEDNWALLYAQELAEQYNTTLSVLFCLRKSFQFATERTVYFMLEGLKEVEESLRKKKIPFYMLLGNPEEEIPLFTINKKIGALVTDLSPLKYSRKWKENIARNVDIPVYEVDAHNIVPVWEASQKQEFGAYTFRPKIHRCLPLFLEDFPLVHSQKKLEASLEIDWEKIFSQVQVDNSIKKVSWITPGEKAAHRALGIFLKNRLPDYAKYRNDPKKHAQSELSPYIHFGHISSQRIALEVEKVRGFTASKDAFLEELIVRKELSDNFCFYNKNYDNFHGFPNWSQKTLFDHRNDEREYIHSLDELEKAKTHDKLWNAAQKEMLSRGKMHGYMRMYWAKKILEWSPTFQDAQEFAIYLNDKYSLDGRDPNGYTGIAWSIGGVHDRAWFERKIFGKIRYMSSNGAKSKFDVEAYIAENS